MIKKNDKINMIQYFKREIIKDYKDYREINKRRREEKANR